MVSSFFPGLIFVLALWIVKWIEMSSGHLLTNYGVLPRTVEGLKGVITSPFIHGDIKHLVSNSIPLLILGAGLFYFYKSLAFRVFAGIYILGGFWLWLGGRESYHIGASGLVYGLTAFLFFSGLLRKDTRLMALSLLVVFLYGGMVWGLFPIFTGVSWEAHLFGSLAGMLFAFAYRKEGPQRKEYTWEKEPEEDYDDENAYWKLPESQVQPPAENKTVHIQYIYKPDSPSKDTGTDEKN